MDTGIEQLYGKRVRVRVCGLCWRDDRLLLVNHHGLTGGDFWAPPGGGIEFQESAHDRLRQEFIEETGLQIAVGEFRFACEFIHDPLHAMELFFDVSVEGGKLMKGDDPELSIIRDVRFLSAEEIAALPDANLHGIFRALRSAEDLRTLTGFFTI